MCSFSSVRQLGIPLNKPVLNTMDSGEQAFWYDFLREAKRVIDMKEAAREMQPFRPPDDLREKYERAVAQYDGRSYCQIRQLEQIFAF